MRRKGGNWFLYGCAIILSLTGILLHTNGHAVEIVDIGIPAIVEGTLADSDFSLEGTFNLYLTDVFRITLFITRLS